MMDVKECIVNDTVYLYSNLIGLILGDRGGKVDVVRQIHFCELGQMLLYFLSELGQLC